MSCRLARVISLLAVATLACAVEDPAAREAPSTGGGVQPSAGGGAPDMMGGQTGEGGGQQDGCFAETWAGPDAPLVRAHCQMIPGTGLGPRYCTCDTRQCPLGADHTPDRACAIEVAFDNLRCSDTMFNVCGVRHNNWCQVSGLTSQQKKTCWTQPDGTHVCQCPGSELLAHSAETECHNALNAACATDCVDQRGHCEYVAPGGPEIWHLNQFRCECELGVDGTSSAYFCEDALRRHCSPACESARGACWKVPDAAGLANAADCLCAGSSQFIHLEQSQWDPHGEECRAPLTQVCGE